MTNVSTRKHSPLPVSKADGKDFSPKDHHYNREPSKIQRLADRNSDTTPQTPDFRPGSQFPVAG
jgi:hypothetical protein